MLGARSGTNRHRSPTRTGRRRTGPCYTGQLADEQGLRPRIALACGSARCLAGDMIGAAVVGVVSACSDGGTTGTPDGGSDVAASRPAAVGAMEPPALEAAGVGGRRPRRGVAARRFAGTAAPGGAGGLAGATGKGGSAANGRLGGRGGEWRRVRRGRFGRRASAGPSRQGVPHSPLGWRGMITVGRNGNLWFTGFFSNDIGRITPSGVVTVFDIPTPGSGASGIAAGPDGNVWFTEAAGNKIGRITQGVITEFADPTDSHFPTSPRARTATSGSQKTPRTRSAASPRRASSPSSPSRLRIASRCDHGGPGRQPLVRRSLCAPDRTNHPRGGHKGVSVRHQRRLRHRRRLRREYLVHGQHLAVVHRALPARGFFVHDLHDPG